MAKVNSTESRTQDQKHNDEVDSLSIEMLYMQEVVKLAAMAAESKRTLRAVNESLAYMPEAKQQLEKEVHRMYAWEDRDENIGDVLTFVADRLTSLNGRLSELAYRKVNAA